MAWIQIDTPVVAGYVQALCLPNPMCDLVIRNIPDVHPEIIGNSGTNTARKVDFDVMVNTCEGSIQVGPSANETSEKEEAGRDLPIEEVKVMQHEDIVKTAELQHVKVMVNPDSEASYETEYGGDVSEQEASHHPTDDDDEDGRMSE